MTYYRDTQFDRVLLEDEQQRLLEILVEAARRVPRENRQKFLVVNEASSYQSFLLHDGLAQDFGAYEGDLEALANERMLSRTVSPRNTSLYDVTPRGYKYYEHLQLEKGTPTVRTESAIRSYIDGDTFQKRYPMAFTKWAEAESLLWAADSKTAFTTIGHHCREAVQEFLDVLLRSQGLTAAEDKAKTVIRLRRILESSAAKSETASAYAESALAFVGNLIDLTQRQEHGGTREGEPLRWEDGRRVVFLTLVTLTEIDRLVSGT